MSHTDGEMEHGEFRDDIGAYLLGALPEPDRARFEAHLAACASCRTELAALRPVTAQLPASVPTVQPPRELRDRIMRTVYAEADLLAASGPDADRAAPARRRERRGFRPFRPIPAAAAAAALAVAAAAGWVVGNGGGNPASKSRVIAAKVVRSAAPNGRASLVVVDDRGTLALTRIPDAPPGRVYEVWVKRAGRAAPQPTNALFTVAADGSATVRVPGRMRGVEQVMVTDEPRGGSRAPTRPPLVAARVS